MGRNSDVVGFIDIGTNSVHLLVVDFVPGTLGVELAHERESIDLGRKLYRNGKVDKKSLDKLKLVLSTYTKFAMARGAKKVFGFATCSSREVDNKSELLKAMKVPGLDIKIIPGEEEARIIRLGVFGSELPKKKTLLIDIGGGSTEFSVSKGKNTFFLDSLPMGAVRYAYGFSYDPKSPIKDDEYSSYKRNVDLHSYRCVKHILQIGFEEVIGSSGTLEALADICSECFGSEPNHLKYSDVEKLMAKLKKTDFEERLKLGKISPARADIIVAGGAIAEEIMFLLNIEDMKISRRGLKDGMVIDYLQNKGIMNVNVRESSINELAVRCNYRKEHADVVKKFALQIFDDLRYLGLHSIPPEMRSLLGYASVLHDIGEFICYDKHQIISYNLIVNSNILGFDEIEINEMALMAKFHHKKIPSPKDKIFKNHSVTKPEDLVKCILILRMADALDRHHLNLVKSIDLEKPKQKVVITLNSDENIDMELWRLSEYRSDFKNCFGAELVIEVSPISVKKGQK